MMFKISNLPIILIIAILCGCNSDQSENNQKETNTGAATEDMDAPNESKAKITPWITYQNERFNFCIQYPGDLLSPAQGSSNNDGHIFTSDNGFELTASAFHKTATTLDEVYNMLLNDTAYGRIEYKNLGEDNFTFSGRKDAKAFQLNVRQHENNFILLLFEYPPSDEEDYRLVMTQILEKGVKCMDS